MTTITERITKRQFVSRCLKEELFGILKDNFDKEKLKLTIKWYDGSDINNVHIIARHLTVKYASNLDGAIREELEDIFDKIPESSVLVLVKVNWINLISVDETKNKVYVSDGLKIVDYKIPTNGWEFNKYLHKWVCKDSDILKEYIETFIVNQLGINLCSVKDIEIDRQADGQLKVVKIEFIPFAKKE